MTDATTDDFAALLPDDPLISECRNDRAALEVAEAPSLRVAAAEVVREGYLLHYGSARFYEFTDPDLALLAADRMYAAGLDALAAASDTEAVGVLATLIAGCAEAHALNDTARADELWATSLAMLARGSVADRPD